MVMIVNLSNQAISSNDSLYEFRHDNLRKNTSPNFQIPGTYHYHITPKDLWFVNLLEKSLYLLVKTIVRSFLTISKDCLVDLVYIEVDIVDQGTVVNPPGHLPCYPPTRPTVA